MGFLDRFKPKALSFGKKKKPKHVVAKSAKERAEEEKRRLFASVPAAGKPAPKVSEPKKEAGGETKRKAERKRKDDTREAYRILLRSHITEKASALTQQQHYVFVVARDANKIAVKRAVESLYGVRPYKVNIVRVQGKELRYGRTEGRTKDWKKAIVTLHPGQKLDIG